MRERNAFSNNIFHNPASRALVVISRASGRTIKKDEFERRWAVGSDRHVNPGLVSPSFRSRSDLGDFHLAPGSPAIDAGADVGVMARSEMVRRFRGDLHAHGHQAPASSLARNEPLQASKSAPATPRRQVTWRVPLPVCPRRATSRRARGREARGDCAWGPSALTRMRTGRPGTSLDDVGVRPAQIPRRRIAEQRVVRVGSQTPNAETDELGVEPLGNPAEAGSS